RPLEAGGYLSPRGLLMVATRDNLALFEADMAGMGMEPLAPEEAYALIPVLRPGLVTRAAYHEAAWDIDTGRLLQDHAAAIRAAGGRVVTGARVTGLARTGAGWAAETAAGGFEARLLVNAAGAWADRVAAMAGVTPVGLQPFRRSMARIPAPGG